jgi:hypothetical protein
MTTDNPLRELRAHELKSVGAGQSSVPPAPPITITMEPVAPTPYAPGGAGTGTHAPLQTPGGRPL